MTRGRSLHLVGIAAVLILVAGAVYLLFATAPEAIVRNRMLVVPGAWKRFLAASALVILGISAVAYLYGLATRPLRAARYAVTAGTHIFLWLVILAVFYPVAYLLAVALNRNDTLAGALPREGNLLVRAGVVPNPAGFSRVQFQ